MFSDSYLQFSCWPPGRLQWSNVLCAGFDLFYKNVIYILIRSGTGLRNKLLKEPLPTDAAILMSDAAPMAQTVSQTRQGVNSFGLRSESWSDKKIKSYLRQVGFKFSTRKELFPSASLPLIEVDDGHQNRLAFNDISRPLEIHLMGIEQNGDFLKRKHIIFMLNVWVSIWLFFSNTRLFSCWNLSEKFSLMLYPMDKCWK